jgi:hypothetical protein
MHGRIWTLAALCAGLLVAVSALTGTALAGGGGSTGAKLCQKDGWQSLVTSTGSTFASQEQCVSYAATGGALHPLSEAPCLNGGWQSPAQRGDGTGFRTEADCFAYAVGGGHVYKPSLTAVPGYVIENQGIVVTAKGFHPNSTGEWKTVGLPSNSSFGLTAVTDATGGWVGSAVFTTGACALGDTGALYTYTDGSGVHASTAVTLLCL